MKRFFPVFLLVLFMIAACSAGGSGEFSRDTLSRLQKEKLPAFTPPEVKEVTLANGIRLFLMEDHTLPVVNMQVILRAGSVYERAALPGLSDVTAQLMRDGGTLAKSPVEIDSLVDDTAVRIGFDSDREMLKASMESLSSEMPATLPLLIDLIVRPRFDAARRELVRLKFIEQIKRNEDDPEFVAARDFQKLMYGFASPWAAYPTVASLQQITPEDIARFWATLVRPNNMLIAAAGDFQADALVRQIEKLTAGIPNDPVQFPAVPEVAYEFKEASRYVAREVNQAYIYMGHLGIKRHNPDKCALQIMNAVLGGGGFKSRLMEDIRSNKGMAYSVWSNFGWGTDYGVFSVYAATKAKNQSEVVDLIRAQVDAMATTGKVTRKEFNFAKDSVLNRLIFEFDEPFKIALSQAQYYFYGYPKNYWEIYRDSVKAVDRGDVKRVAKQYLHPDGLKTLIVGPAENQKL